MVVAVSLTQKPHRTSFPCPAPHPLSQFIACTIPAIARLSPATAPESFFYSGFFGEKKRYKGATAQDRHWHTTIAAAQADETASVLAIASCNAIAG